MWFLASETDKTRQTRPGSAAVATHHHAAVADNQSTNVDTARPTTRHITHDVSTDACTDAVRQRYVRDRQEAQLSPSDRAMRLVSSNLANYHATVQKLLI